MIRKINQILRLRIRTPVKIINHKARKATKILPRKENIPNAASGEAILLRSEHPKNHLTEANMATTGNNGSQGRIVKKISGSRYNEDSDNEEDCL